MRIVAHRGAQYGLHLGEGGDACLRAHVENTLAAFRKAAALGVAAIELDVMSTKDRQLVVHHDTRLGRLFRLGEGRPYVRDLRLSELRNAKADPGASLDAAQLASEGLGVVRVEVAEAEGTIPTLDDVFGLFAARATSPELYVELKTRRRTGASDDHLLPEHVLECVAGHDLKEKVVVISFNEGVLRRAREIDPGVRIGLCTVWRDYASELRDERELLDRVLSLGAALWLPPYDETTTEAIEAAHIRGLQVVSWARKDTVLAELDKIERLASAGVDGVVTNIPQIAMRHLGGSGLLGQSVTA